MNGNRWTLVLTWGLLVLALVMMGLMAGQSSHAQPVEVAVPRAELRVCVEGPPACDYATIQDAVDAAAEGDVVKVAAGVYSGVQSRPAPPGYDGPAVITQAVYLSKTLSIQGGYTLTNWTEPDPEANPTTLDAQGLGRALLIAGTISPTVAGLRLTGGDAAELGGGVYDAGGGVYVVTATASISNCQVYSNTASTTGNGLGGGLHVGTATASISNCQVYSNTASAFYSGGGGGLHFAQSVVTLRGSVIQGNLAAGDSTGAGGGIWLEESSTTLSGNLLQGNIASTADDYNGYGGGLYFVGGDATLTGNLVQGNIGSTADHGIGGGLFFSNGDVVLNGNVIAGNTASYGGGLLVGGIVTSTNDIIVDNVADYEGSGMLVEASSSLRLSHATIARNHGGNGSGIHVWEGGTTIALTNTILASHTVGITVEAGSTATLEGTLWHGNGVDTGGEGTIVTGTINVYGDPAFVDPDAGDYHLGYGSAAIDAGVDAGVATDIDGDPRPMGLGYDIGADELGAQLILFKSAFPDPVAAGAQLTYTLRLTNSGPVSLTATITDLLPAHVTPGGVLVWTPAPLPPNEVWTETVVITVDVGYSGPLTNVVRAAAEEGATGAYTRTVTVEVPINGLVAVNDSPTVLEEVTTLTATVTAGSNVDYTWALGDDTIGSGAVVTHTYPLVGVYTAVVTASNSVSGLTATTQVIVTGEEIPIEGLAAANDSPTVLGEATTLTATVTAGSNVDYTWALGDDTSGSGAVVSHIYPTEGIYTAVVTASNSVGELTATTRITIAEPGFSVYLPLVLRQSP